MSDRRPGEGRYAHVEREQRWIVTGVPATAERVGHILDRYITGTRLRLRRVETSAGVVCKLGQKVRVDPTDPGVVKLTNVYLTGDEYDVVVALPAAELAKTRWHVEHDRRRFAFDEFGGRHRGLVLAETELGLEDDVAPAPPEAVREVTHDDRFSGGALAHASDEALLAVLDQVCRLDGQSNS